MTTPASPAPTRTCGACRAPVAADAVTCPACGAFLAAYETATGAAPAAAMPVETSATQDFTPTDTSATRDAVPADTSATQQSTPPVPPPPVTPASPPLVHRPTSRSPIGDALRRSQSDSAWYQAPAEPTLAEMADGDDALADMASGKDDLAEMAAGDSTLAEEVEAELAGAKVTFDGGGAKIEAAPESAPSSRPAARPTAATAAPRPAPAASPAPRRADRPAPAQRTRRGVYEDPPIAWVETDSTGRVANRPTGTSERQIAGLPMMAIGIGSMVMLCVVLSIASRLSVGLTALIPLVITGVVIWSLLKGAGATGRKTTTMPRDKRR